VYLPPTPRHNTAGWERYNSDRVFTINTESVATGEAMISGKPGFLPGDGSTRQTGTGKQGSLDTGKDHIVQCGRQDYEQCHSKTREPPMSQGIICFSMQAGWFFGECYRSRPELFLCGHPREKCGFISPVHALPFPGKNAILRNINSPNILIQTNPGIL